MQEDYDPPRNPFGTDAMDFALKAFYRECGDNKDAHHLGGRGSV